MANKNSQKLSQHPAEEIEWTDEDDAIMDKVMAKLRAKGVKADPVAPVRLEPDADVNNRNWLARAPFSRRGPDTKKPIKSSHVTKQSNETPSQ